MTTGFITDDLFLAHDTGPNHPESAARLVSVRRHLASCAWYSRLIQVTPQPLDLAEIEPIHPLGYVRRVEAACRAGARHLDCVDVAISPASFPAALGAVAASVTLAGAIADDKVTNGFALVRPPGHHAERTNAMGFCLFNNIAVTARYLQKHHGVDKVAIVDWDVHHGNGTQHAFYEDPSVLYISLHQYPFYPGTGASTETGKGKGMGATLNCPLPAGSSDATYQKAFTDLVLPKLASFRPEFVLISAGFDAHRDDPLAEMELTTGCFGWMTARLLESAAESAEGKVLSLLEGGYDVDRLAECVAVHVETLSAVGDA